MSMENSAMPEAPTAAQQRYETSDTVAHHRSLPHERFGLSNASLSAWGDRALYSSYGMILPLVPMKRR